ncbi:dienelactone hydrolase family protein [Sphingobacterium hungaricum]
MNKIILLTVSMIISNYSFGQLKEVTYSENSQELKGLVGKPKSGNAGVLILPAWKGIDNEAKEAAKNLAEAGYISFIADIYGVGHTPATNEEAGKAAGYYKTNFEAYQKRIKAGLDELIKQGADPNKIVVIGYCFGGTGALEAARGQLPVQAAVSIHGGLSKGNRQNVPIKTKVLVLHGADDASVSKADIDLLTEELNAGKTDWQMIYYAQSKHTFTNPESADYNEIMAKRSWEHLMLFLKEVL